MSNFKGLPISDKTRLDWVMIFHSSKMLATNETDQPQESKQQDLDQKTTTNEPKMESKVEIKKPILNPMRNNKMLNSPTDLMFSPATQKIEQKRNHLFKKY